MPHASHNRSSAAWAAVAGCLWCTLAAVGGCSFDAHDCTQGVECPSGYVCNVGAGICDPLSADTDTAGDDTSREDSHADAETAPDAGRDASPPEDTAVPPDTGAEDAGGVCVVDLFSTSCQADSYERNEDWVDAHIITNDAVGCSRHDDEVAPFDRQLTEATLCPSDADWYTYSVMECRNRSFIMEVSIEPTQACQTTVFNVAIQHGDTEIASCTNPATDSGSNWQCAALDNGGKKLSYIVAGNNPQFIKSHYVAISPTVDGHGRAVRFNYDVRVRIKP